MKKITRITSVLLLMLMVMSCNTDDLLKDSKMVPADSTKISLNSKLNIKYNREKNMFVVNGVASDLKNFVYSEDEKNKQSVFLEAYVSGFEPLTVYGGIQDEHFDQYSEHFELIKERKSFEIMNFSDQIDVEVIGEMEKNGFDLDESTFIGDNDFASLLNYNGQIQINDSIYMYTPKGLFMVISHDSDKLEDFVRKNPKIEISEGRTMLEGSILAYKPTAISLKLPSNIGEGQFTSFHTPSAPNTTYPFELPTNTNNYSNCANIKKPWFPNLFGNSYRCTHNITSTSRIKSIFRVQDFFFFNHTILKTTHQREKQQSIKIKIWPFKIKIKLFKYWENASADKLYSKINLAYFDVKRSNTSVTVSDSDVKSIFQKISNFIHPSQNNTQSKAMYVLNDEYILNTSGSYSQKNFNLTNADLTNHNNYLTSILYPTTYTASSSVSLPNMNFLSDNKKKVLLNAVVYNYNLTLTTDDILGIAKKLINDYVNKGFTKEDIGVIMNEINLKNLPADKLTAPTTKIILSGEVITKQGTHKVERSFGIRKEFKLEEIIIGMKKTDQNNSKFKLKVTFSSNTVANYHVDFESGVFSNGIWGGVKYSITN